MLSLKNAHTAEIQNCSVVMTVNECFSSSGEMFLRENVIFEISSAKNASFFVLLAGHLIAVCLFQ